MIYQAGREPTTIKNTPSANATIGKQPLKRLPEAAPSLILLAKSGSIY
jgi:hypothetical protein